LLEEKAERLRNILCSYKKVAVAFSGGVDSSLVLKCALDTLGEGRVLVLHGRSCLQNVDEAERAMDWLERHGFGKKVERQVIDVYPLLWNEFVQNSENRCYICKSKVFSLFLERAKKWGTMLLLDGTNKDDLNDTRPGLLAINELGVETPLVKAGFTKEDVRQLSRQLHLDTWNKISSSCLATRIPTGLTVTAQRLERIAFWENALHDLGFDGCRARMDSHREDTVYLEFLKEDMVRLGEISLRSALVHFFDNNGVKRIYLDLGGR